MTDDEFDDRRAFIDHMVRLASVVHSQPQEWGEHAEPLLAAIAHIINDHSFEAWGIEVRIRCLGQRSPLAPYIAADLRRRQQRLDCAEWQRPLSTEQAKLVTDHIQLVRKYAGNIAKGNPVLFAELEALGLRQLEESARKYDSSRRVSFGAYAKHRLRGAMLDYAVLNRNRAVAVGGRKRGE